MQHITIGGTSYDVLRELSGGLFHDSMLLERGGAKFVLKLFKLEYASALEQQWERWTSSGSSISGQALIKYLEVGSHEGRPYVLREWVEGDGFDAFARRMKINGTHLDCALAMGQAICRAVALLHDVGVMHGHIHNANVLFDKEGNPTVVDPWLGTPTAMTAQLATKRPGSQGTLAPEQTRVGGKVDARTDVWQLGLLLARLYSRKPDIVVNPRFLMELYNARLPMNLIKVLWQALQDEQSNRFSDASTLATALAEVTLAEHQRTVYVRPLPPARGVQDRISPAMRNSMLFVGAVGAVALAAWLYRGSENVTPSIQTTSDAVVSRGDFNRTSGVSVTDLRVGSGGILEVGDYSRLRFLAQRVSHAGHRFKNWSGEAEVSLLLSPDGPQVAAVWQSLVGMREGGVRRIVIGPPESNELTGVRGGQSFQLPSGTVWEYEVEALTTLPEPRSRIGIAIDTESAIVGAMVTEVVGDPARQAGLAPGDLITSIDDVTVGSGQHAMRILRRKEPRVPVEVIVSRGGAELELTVLPGDPPERGARDLASEAGALWIGGDAILP